MADENKPMVPPLKTADQARNYVEEVLVNLETARLLVDTCRVRKEQQGLYARFLIKQGYVTGVLDVLVGCGLLSPAGYDQARARATRTMLPSAARGITIPGAKA